MIEIRLATFDDVPSLSASEGAAADLFLPYPEIANLSLPPVEVGKYYAAQRRGHLWVAALPAGAPIGFAMVEILADSAHLEEIDVHPDFGRQGSGAKLVETVCRWAQAGGMKMVTLTTFRDIPWNEYFYRKMGFEELKTEELSAALAERIEDEERRGLPRHLRLAMGYMVL
jgi:GNAT superfamily N-acetyltransferase